MTASPPLRFVKGHGTENDFVLLPDADGRLAVGPALVRALCDRRAGIGGDGVLRVVRTAAVPDEAATSGARDAEWFMDYRNADGSPAQMCGNGLRVFARYLVESGLAPAGTLRIATRSGVRTATVPVGGGDVTVDVGPAVLTGESVARVAGRAYVGVAVSTGNPHLVCGTGGPVEDLDLGAAPDVDPADFPEGVNVEMVNVVPGPPPAGSDLHVRMRVHERGVGETRSCGTGAVAVAAVALRGAGRAAGTVTVDVPGGRLTVTDTGETSLLAGPAVLVGDGVLAPGWLAAAEAAVGREGAGGADGAGGVDGAGGADGGAGSTAVTAGAATAGASA